MGKALTDFAMQAGQQVMGGITGAIFGGINDRRQLKQAKKLQELEMQGARAMGEFNQQQQMEMWHNTNYSAQMAELEKAGLNPGLLYGMGGGGGATAQSTPGHVSGNEAPKGGGEAVAMAAEAAQLGLLRAQKENIEADTKDKLANLPVKGATKSKLDVETGLLKLDKSFYEQTFDARINKLDREIELIKQQARKIDQDTGIDADKRESTVMQAQAEAMGAVLQNLLIGEKTKATTQEIEESKARVTQMDAQMKKWTAEINQGWYGLSLKEKELRLDAIMKEVEAVTSKKGIGDLPALTPNQRRQVIRQIDKVASIGEKDY